MNRPKRWLPPGVPGSLSKVDTARNSHSQVTDLGLGPGDDCFSAAYKITNGGMIVGESYAFDDLNGHGSHSQGVAWGKQREPEI